MKVKLELVGLNGNAFALLGAFTKAARRQKMPQAELDAIMNEARSGDYDHLLATLIEHTESPDDEDDDDEREN